jgi:AbrB family looped-hinge helix DNA binding protein
MSESEVIKITSKGQVTIPSRFRKELSLDRDSYLYVTRAGNMLVLKKVDTLSLEEISTILGSIAETEGITKEILFEEAKKARKAFLEEKNVKA